jgi:hypothetical protein
MDSSSIEFFYKHCIDTSSDDEFGDDTDVFMVETTLIHDHKNKQLQVSRGK